MSDGSVTIEVTLTKEQLEKGLKSVKSDLNSLNKISVSKTIDGISKAFHNMGSIATTAGKACSVVTGAVTGVFTAAAAKAKSFIGVYESAKSIFERKLGATGADDMYNALLKVAKGSRYAQEYIVSAGQTLVAMGVDATHTAKYVQIATDAMSGMGKSGADVQAMAEMFGKMSIQTTLYTEDLNQMLTSGVRVYDILAKKYNKSTDAIKEMASAGELTSKDFEYLMDVLAGNVAGMEEFSMAGLALAGKSNTLTGAIDSLNSSFRSFALNILGMNINKGQMDNYEKLKNVVALLGTTLENVGSKFSFVSGWVSKGLDTIKSALTKFNDTLNSMKPETLEKIAKAIGGLAASGPILLTVGKGLNILGNGFSGLNNIVGGLEKTGSVFSSFTGSLTSVPSKLNSVASSFGTFGGKIASGLSTMFSGGIFEKAGNLLSTGFDKITGVVSTFGGKLLSPIQALGEKIGTFLSPVKNAFDKIIVSSSLFGQLLKFNLGETLNSLFPNVSAGLSKITDAFGGAFSGILSKVGSFASSFLPVFMNAFGIAAVIGVVVAGLGLLQSNFGEQINNILTMVTTQGPLIIQNLVNGITSKLPSLIEMGGTLLNNFMLAITANLPSLISGGIEIVSTLVTGIAGQLPTLIPTAVELIMTIFNSIIENLPTIIEAGLQLLVSLIQGIVNAIPQLIDMLPTIITTICDVITRELPNIIKAGITILVSLINGLVNAIPQLIAMLPTIINTIVGTLLDNLPLIIDAGIQILIALINGLVEAIPQLIEMLPQIITTIVTVLARNFPKIVEAGGKIITSIVAGIISLLGKLGEAGWKIIESIGNVLKELPRKSN